MWHDLRRGVSRYAVGRTTPKEDGQSVWVFWQLHRRSEPHDKMRSKESQAKRSVYFARKEVAKRSEQNYFEVAPGIWLKT